MYSINVQPFDPSPSRSWGWDGMQGDRILEFAEKSKLQIPHPPLGVMISSSNLTMLYLSPLTGVLFLGASSCLPLGVSVSRGSHVSHVYTSNSMRLDSPIKFIAPIPNI